MRILTACLQWYYQWPESPKWVLRKGRGQLDRLCERQSAASQRSKSGFWRALIILAPSLSHALRTWYTCTGSWHHDFACLGKTSHFCDIPFFTAQNMQICPDWVSEPSLQVLSYSPSLKTVIASFIVTRMLLIHVTVSMIMILIWSRKDSYSDRLCETRQPANGQVIVAWSNLEPLLESSHILPARHSRTRVVLREEWGLKSLYKAVVVHSNAFYFWV